MLPHTHRSTLVVGSSLMLLAGGVMVAFRQPKDSPSAPVAQAASGSTELAVAVKTPFDITTTATGELAAAKQIELRNPLEEQTTIVEIIKEGTRVNKGDVVIRLNTQAIEQRVAQERLSVEQSRAQLKVAENAVSIQGSDNNSALKKADLDLEVARLEYRQWEEGEVKSKRQELSIALERAQRELTRLKDKFERSQALAKEGFLSTDELKRDELAYLEAEASLKTAQLNSKVYEEIQFGKDKKVKESSIEQAEANLARVKSNNASQLESREAELHNQRESLKLREANLAKMEEQVASATLKAPNDGLVVYATSLERERWGGGNETLDVGKQVWQNQLLVALPDTTEMVASVRVHEALAGKIKPDQPATVKIDALGGKSVPGKVLSVGVIAESGGWRDPNLREYTVRIKLDLSEGATGLKPSMRCEAEILLDRVPPVLCVPVQAIFSEGLVRYLVVPEGKDSYSRRPVKIGRRSDRFIEVLGGIDENQQVLLRNPKPGEMREQPWSDEQLAAVGLKKNGEGRVIPIGGGNGGTPGEGAPVRVPSGPGRGGPGMGGGTGGAGGGNRPGKNG